MKYMPRNNIFLIVTLTVVALISQQSQADDTSVANIFVRLAKKMVPSVVNVLTASAPGQRPLRGGQGPGPGMPNDPNDLWRHFFDEFFGSDPYGQGPGRGDPQGPGNNRGGKVQALGSGFILEVTGDEILILTNNHVIDSADEVKIKFTESADEKPVAATVVGKDPELDVALLKVKSKQEVLAVTLGDSDKLEQGEWVMAVGNPFGHGHSVAKGIVSAKERTLPGSYSRYLQVDAPINPGNSGGPLANLNGEVVGINNAVLANAQGIGFAIPINLVKKVLPQLKEKGRVDRGFIGINIDELSPKLAKEFNADEKLRAPFVTNVIKGGAADRAGIRAYDIITDVDGKKVRDSLELVAAITDIPVGTSAKVKVLRQGKEKTFTVKVDRRPISEEEIISTRQNKSLQKEEVSIGAALETLNGVLRRDLGLPAKTTGVVVMRVDYGSPADSAGLTRGDVILEVDRKSVVNTATFYKLIARKKTYILRVRRQDPEGGEAYVVVSLDLSDAPKNNADGEEEE